LSTIQTIDNELPSTARPKINTNFSNLNTDKQEKAGGAVTGNFAAFGASNVLQDSGKSGSSFASVSHTHSESDVTGLTTDLGNKALKGANTDITSLSPTGDLSLNPTTSKVSHNAGRIVLRDNSIEEHATNGTSQTAANYAGYNGGSTQFRDFVFYDGKGNEILRVDGAKRTLDFPGASAPSAPAAGHGAIYYDSSTNKFKVAENGGSFGNLVSGSYKNGVTTKNAADASTTQNIAHGLGGIPKFVRIRAMLGTSGGILLTSETVYNGTTQSSLSFYNINAGAYTYDTTFTLNNNNSSSTQTGVVTFDATNIIITWTKTNSPTGTYNLLWEAIG
jgi:hypothetical protein